MNQIEQVNQEQYTKRDRLASVGRRLYLERYKEVRRPDGTRLWKDAQALACVIGRGVHEGSVNHYASGSAKYVKDVDAIPFLEDYIRTRINSNGMTRSTIEAITSKTPKSLVKFGWLGNMLGMPEMHEQLRDMTELMARLHDQLEELNEAWRTTPIRDNDVERHAR